jgi:hypothetical protein
LTSKLEQLERLFEIETGYYCDVALLHAIIAANHCPFRFVVHSTARGVLASELRSSEFACALLLMLLPSTLILCELLT